MSEKSRFHVYFLLTNREKILLRQAAYSKGFGSPTELLLDYVEDLIEKEKNKGDNGC